MKNKKFPIGNTVKFNFSSYKIRLIKWCKSEKAFHEVCWMGWGRLPAFHRTFKLEWTVPQPKMCFSSVYSHAAMTENQSPAVFLNQLDNRNRAIKFLSAVTKSAACVYAFFLCSEISYLGNFSRKAVKFFHSMHSNASSRDKITVLTIFNRRWCSSFGIALIML
ncbi:Mei4p [Saccharomyces cerevisiae x Saccharomyces kudriavzevii VIN7]|uniref:Mei4p n=1 Tax=Saccharomyces cerevisiae x Saccharomyces kudriavzevii (strain VIN7) TaxID=1095631 RepID=H0GTU5_SACCK|nr:Mei4p [Saccharomyces cerevisiae x Saccharomyces kudriavzevii VIN7]